MNPEVNVLISDETIKHLQAVRDRDDVGATECRGIVIDVPDSIEEDIDGE